MRVSRIIGAVVAIVIAVSFVGACGQKKESHWGQELRIDKKWWKKEGQSWDRESNIFMAIGYSNPSWKHKYDQRKSADLDARSQVASFMNSLAKNYMEEVRSHNFTIAESTVQISADEAILGSVIVARKKKRGRYMSLIKVDLGYFFGKVYRKYLSDMESKMRRRNRRMSHARLNQLIEEKTDAALARLQALEEPVIEETIEREQNRQ